MFAAQLMLLGQQLPPQRHKQQLVGQAETMWLGTSHPCLLLCWALNMRSKTQQCPPRRGTHKPLTPCHPHTWCLTPDLKAGQVLSICSVKLLLLFTYYSHQMQLLSPFSSDPSGYGRCVQCEVRMVQVRLVEGHCPGPAPQHMALRTSRVSSHSLRHHSSWSYTSWGCSWPVTWSLTHFGGMRAQSLSPQQPGCVSTAPGLGLPGGLTTPHLQSRGGRLSPLPIHGHLCTVLHPTGVKDDHAQGTVRAQHKCGLSSLWSLSYSKL